MKILILPFFTCIAFAASAQLSIVPQVGVDAFRTTIKTGEGASFSPLHQRLTPTAAVRVSYSLPSGQGAFLGVAAGRQSVGISFFDPQNVHNSYTANTSDVDLRLEAGYQFTSKPITLKKQAVFSSAPALYSRQSNGSKQSGCARSLCNRMRNPGSDTRASFKKAPTDGGLYMRIKPAVGLAFAPASTILTKNTSGQPSYIYTASMNTALVVGTAFELGTRSQAKLMVSFNYLKELGNSTQTLVHNEVLKQSTTTFRSNTSGFNINLGIPITFKKKTQIIQKQPLRSPSRYGHCGRFKLYEL